ncbi:hypothetical protein MMC34_007910 [Xylographa carneopallida]|nr:hypothetical protein [Xylographa carneopallida]
MDQDRESDSIPPPYRPQVGTSEINVLIVGETQHGKSTLVQSISSYTGAGNEDIEIGDNSQSCTREVGRYPITTTIDQYQLVDHNGHPILEQSWKQLYKMRTREARVEKIAEPQRRPPITFNFFDTPGLGDSGGRDMEIMVDIFGRLATLKHVSAMIYVRAADKPFSTSFAKFFDYLRRSMPSLCNGLIILHSKYTTTQLNEALDRGEENPEEIRRQTFAKKTGLDLPHFFLDNEPSERSPFAQLRTLNETSNLLSHIESQVPLKVTGLRLLKTERIQRLQGFVASDLRELARRLEVRWEEIRKAASMAEQLTMDSEAEATRCEAAIERIESQIRDLSGVGLEVLGTRTVSQDYKIYKHLIKNAKVNLKDQTVYFEGDCKIQDVRKSASSGSKWGSESTRGSSWHGTLSSNMMRSMHGTVTFYGRTCDINAKEIALLRASANQQSTQLDFVRNQAKKLRRLTGGDEEMVKKLRGGIESCYHQIKAADSELYEVSVHEKIKDLYRIDGRPSRPAVIQFIEALDPALAMLMVSYG